MQATSKEAIFQLWSESTPGERNLFIVSTIGPIYGSVRPATANSFETGDQRWTVWGRSRVVSGVTYYYTLKYLSFSLPPLDYFTVLRLAEQYLIRAEARAQQNDINGAKADINIIRTRAGLGNTTANDEPSLLLAVEDERKHEFFNEWGHRWFDLKRMGRADAVLAPIKPQWKSTAVLFPIPEAQIINNPNTTQNPGY
ncbi:MAG: RagB/SusD family nutrient uptake outer membrane protein [Bacteroidota bacterium]